MIYLISSFTSYLNIKIRNCNSLIIYQGDPGVLLLSVAVHSEDPVLYFAPLLLDCRPHQHLLARADVPELHDAVLDVDVPVHGGAVVDVGLPGVGQVPGGRHQPLTPDQTRTICDRNKKISDGARIFYFAYYCLPVDVVFPEGLVDPLREVHVAPDDVAGVCRGLDVEEGLDTTLCVVHT